MTVISAPTLRRAVAALLMTLLALSGIGRGWAAGPASEPAIASIGGMVVPICHEGSQEPGSPLLPDQPGTHDCCEQCVLGAAIILAAPPVAGAPARAAAAIQRTVLVRWPMRVSRTWTPRQAQGPPGA